MDTSTIDLNLLATLDVLLEERNVTHAAQRLHLSQPALSTRLSRLRHALGDPLLVPARHGMVPTQRAAELHPALHAALERLRDTVAASAPFDPAQTTATVRIAASDYVQRVLLVPLVRTMELEAPHITFSWQALDLASMPGRLERGELDLAITRPEMVAPPLHTTPLYEERYVLIARRDHPTLGRSPHDALDRRTLRTLRYAVMSPEGTDLVVPGAAAQRLGPGSGSAVVTAPGFPALTDLVAATDLIALVPAQLTQGRADLRVFDAPSGVPGFAIAMAWHERTQTHPLHRWLRERVRACAAALG